MHLRVWIVLSWVVLFLAGSVSAGVDREIQDTYIQNYKNRALYLKVPVHGLRQMIHVRGGGPTLDQSNVAEPLAFKVGDQVRITDVDFKDEFIRFKIAAVDFSRQSELIFQFPEKLLSDFPNRDAFERALEFTLTEGLSYREIDTAKETFIGDQFDRLIEQFAATTGTSSEYVVRTISEKNPEYLRIQEALSRSQQQAEALKSDLEKEQARRRESESEAARAGREYEDQEARIRTLKVENTSLTEERDRGQRQLRQLAGELDTIKKQQKSYEEQVSRLMRSLDVQTSGNTELGQQVKSLSQVVSTLKTERNDLSQKLEAGRLLNEELSREKGSLNQKVADLEQANSRLSANLRLLTSDKNSINASYLKLKEEKEIMDIARSLADALQLRSRQSEAGRRVSDLYLLSSKIGTLEVQAPEQIGNRCEMRLTLESPDTVKFSEKERELHAVLGERVRVEPIWRTDHPTLEIQLVGGDPVQIPGPRESASWVWSFNGDTSQPATVALSMQITDTNQQEIHLPSQEYSVRPAGLGGLLTRSFSFWSVGLAFLIGAILATFALYVKSGSGNKAHAIRRPEYVAEKRL